MTNFKIIYLETPLIVSRAVNCLNLFIRYSCLWGERKGTHLDADHTRQSDIPSLLEPLMWRGSCPLKTFGTPSLQQKAAVEPAHIPQQPASRDCFPESICLLVSHFPCVFIWALVSGDSPFLSFSLSFVKQKSCSCPLCREPC